MSEKLHFQLSESELLKIVGEHVNRTLFKTPLVLTGFTPPSDGGFYFTFVAEPAKPEPRVSKPRKPKEAATVKRGLKGPVLEPQAREANGAEVQP